MSDVEQTEKTKFSNKKSWENMKKMKLCWWQM